MRVTIQLPDELVAKIDIAAKSESLSCNKLIVKAVVAYLRRHDSQQITEELNRLYSTESSALDPVFEEMQARTMARFAERW